MPRDKNGHIESWFLNAMIGALKRDIQQVRSVARELNMTKDEEYRFQRWVEEEKRGRGMPAGYTFSYSELIELGHEFLGR